MFAASDAPATAGAGGVDVEAIVRRHHTALLSYASRLTGDPDEAADLVQETIMRVWRQGPAPGSRRRSMRSHLQTVLHNVAVDVHRRRAARPSEVLAGSAVDVGELVSVHGGEPVVEDPSGPAVDRLAMLQLFRPLQDSQLSVVQKLYLEGLSTTEAADALRIPPGTVKSRNRQAVRLMRHRAGLDRPGGVRAGNPPAWPEGPAGPAGPARTEAAAL